MTFFEWTEKMETGVKVIDMDHRSLVDSINALAEVIDGPVNQAVLRQVTGNLVAFVDTHFAREEAMMRQYEFPDYPEHKERHRTMRLFIHSAAHVIDQNPEFVDLGALLEVLKTWLNHHILFEDMKYVSCIRSAEHFHPDDVDFEEPSTSAAEDDASITVSVPASTVPMLKHIAQVLREKPNQRFMERQLDELSNRQIETLTLKDALVHIAPICNHA